MSDTENSSDKKHLWVTYGPIVVILILFIILLNIVKSLVGDITGQREDPDASTPTQTIPTPIVVERGTSPNVDVRYETSEIFCLGNGEVDYSIIDLYITGGITPFEFRVENMVYQTLGPFPLSLEEEPIRLKIYGGESTVIKVWSYGSKTPDWVGVVSVPTNDPFCASTPTPMPSHTLEPIMSVTPDFTFVVPPTDISTHLTKKPTVVASSPTPEPTDLTSPSNTPIPTPTHTLVVVPSNTLSIFPSNTPIVIPSNTPIPPPSKTPKPSITSTSTVINPNPKECEDGIDNDNDNLIDFPNDPQCTRPGDTHEDK